MIYGIVGHEALKFTAETEALARQAIREVILNGATVSGLGCFDESGRKIKVVSGKCHLGGIDIWAIEIAKQLGCDWEEFPPKQLRWSGGFKERNIKIAYAADEVISIVVKRLPKGYVGMKFSSCYHCHTNTHVKSGGCWTLKYAKMWLNKPGRAIEI